MRIKTLQPQVRMLERQGKQLERPRGANARGYTYRWQQYRLRWLAEHPLCGDTIDGPSAAFSECVRQSRTTAATDVDHIQRIHGADDPLFWKPANHQSLCHSCHSVKTQDEQAGG